MRYLFAFAILAASFSETSCLQAEDSLFSEVAMESVFEKNATLSADVASIGDGETLDRVTGVSSLMLALKAAGFTAKQDNNRATIQVDHAGWKLPVTLEVQVEQDRIVCEMALVEIKDVTTVTTDALLGLLSSGDVTSGAFFAYDSKTKLVQVRTSIQNRAITARQLKADLLRLASLAEKHADVWSKLNAKPAAKTASAGSGTAGSSVPATSTTTFSIVGRWAAALSSGESFAIEFGSDSTFKLVTIKSGKSSVSKGKTTRVGNQLTLVGDDKVTLNCSVSQSAADKFQLAINDTKGVAKVKLNFTKAK